MNKPTAEVLMIKKKVHLIDFQQQSCESYVKRGSNAINRHKVMDQRNPFLTDIVLYRLFLQSSLVFFSSPNCL